MKSKTKEVFVRLGGKDLIISKEDFHNHKYGTDCTYYFIGYEDKDGNECKEDGTYLNKNDNEPIEENWYGLFDKQKSEIEKDKQRREIEKLVERLEMIENDSELTTKFRKIYATDFDIIKACIRENMVKKKAIKIIKQLTKDYEG